MDTHQRKQETWQLIVEQKGSMALDRVHKRDTPGETEIRAGEEEFLDHLGVIGRLNVQKLDHGFHSKGFAAWCKLFAVQFPTLRGTDGGEWKMAEELTLTRFEAAFKRKVWPARRR